MKPITKATEALENITRLQEELGKSADLAERLGLVHAWYVDTRDPTKPLFGFSKFVGYQSLDAETYLRDSKELDGRNTEWILKDFFDEVEPNTQRFEDYRNELVHWLAQFGKTPRKKIRLMVLKPELREKDEVENRKILELLVAVAADLPAHQRQELKRSI